MRKVFLLAAIMPTSLVLAGTETWVNPANSNWNTAANWSPAVVPNAIGETAIFTTPPAGPITVSVDINATVGTVAFDNANPYTLSAGGGSLAFSVASGNAGLTVTNVNGNGAHVIAAPMTLNSNLILSQGGTSPFTLSGIITGAGTVGLTLTGTGASAATNTLILSGANGATFLGGVTVTTGVLQCGAANTLSSGPLTLTGGSLKLVTFNQTVGALSGAGLIDLGLATLTVNTPAASTNTYSGVISNTGGLTVGGTGTLIVTGTNTYTGTTLVTGTATLQGNTTTFPGAITDNATLAFDQATSASFPFVISGTGALVKKNSGTLTLTVANTYGGGTTISAGILQNGIINAVPSTGGMAVASGAIWDLNNFTQTTGSLSGAGSIINLGLGQTLTSAGTASSTFSGSISGAGAFIYSGSGPAIALTLSGANPYTGGTTVTQGILQGGATNAFPINGNMTLTGGTLQLVVGGSSFNQIIGTLSGSGGIDLGSAQLTIDAAASATYSGAITGTGSIVYAGVTAPTALLLTGVSNYTGGTFVTSGTLRNGVAGALPATGDVTITTPGLWDLNSFNQTIGALAGSGNVTFGAGNTLIAGNAETTTYSGVLSGSGHLTKQNGGTLILSGPNTYSAGTNITGGVLQGNTTSLQGSIVTGGGTFLVFDQAFSGTFAGTTTGTGTLVKNGVGTTRLDGANSASATTINGGTLSVGSGATLTSPIVVVGSAGTLGGTGTVVAATGVTNSGAVQPGSSIGTLNIVGNYTQAPGSMLKIELSPTATSLLNVTGNVLIQSPSTVMVLPDAGLYNPTTIYTIVSASGTVTGTYSSLVTSSNPFFSGTLTYQAAAPGFVQLGLNLLPFSDVIHGGNPGQVAKCMTPAAFSSSADFLSVTQELIFLPIDQVRQALDEMQPSQLKALALTEENNLLLVRTAISQRAQELSQTYSQLDATNNNRFTAWGNLSGDFLYQQNQQENIGFRAKTGTVVAGVDGRVGHHLILGIGGGIGRSDLHWKKSRGNGTIRGYYLGPYLGAYGEHGFMNLSLVGTLDHYTASRHMKFGTINRKAHNSHSGCGAIAHIDIGAIVYARHHLTVSPIAGFDYVYLFEKGFTEKGAQSLNLKVDNAKADLLRSELGLKLARSVLYEAVTWTHDLKASWIYEKRTLGEHYKAGFQDQSCRFTVEGMHPDRNIFDIATGLNALFFEDHFSISLRYEGEFGQHYSDQTGYFQLLLRF